MTPIHVVGTIDRIDWCDIYCGKLVFQRLSFKYQKLTAGLNYQSFVLSMQLASTSLCCMQILSILCDIMLLCHMQIVSILYL